MTFKSLSLQEGIWIAFELLTTLAFSFLFGLPLMDGVILFAMGLAMTPGFIYFQWKWRQEEEQFFMLTDFLQQLVSAFKQHPKIYASLIECNDMNDGPLKSSVDAWIEALSSGGYPRQHAQQFIEKWPHFIVGNLIHLMLAVENYGTFNYGEGLEIIQDDIEDWIEDTYAFKQQQSATRHRIQVLALMSLGIAWSSHAMLFKTDMIESLTFYHFTIFLFLVMILVTLLIAEKSISTPWLEKKEMIWRKSS